MQERTFDEIVAQDNLDDALNAYVSDKATRKPFERVSELNRVRQLRLKAEAYERVIKDTMKLTGE